MVGATEAEATQKDEAAADGTKQEDTTLVGTATEVPKEEGTTEEGNFKPFPIGLYRLFLGSRHPQKSI